MSKALAVITLALGIGASTAMFSFVHPMLLHPLLYPRADRLVVIDDRDSKGGRGSSWPEVRDFRQGSGLLRRGSLGVRVLFPDRS